MRKKKQNLRFVCVALNKTHLGNRGLRQANATATVWVAIVFITIPLIKCIINFIVSFVNDQLNALSNEHSKCNYTFNLTSKFAVAQHQSICIDVYTVVYWRGCRNYHFNIIALSSRHENRSRLPFFIFFLQIFCVWRYDLVWSGCN